MASGPPHNVRVNSVKTRATNSGPLDIGFGQRIRNGVAESNVVRLSPTPARTASTHSTIASRTSTNSVQRPAQSSPRSTYSSPNNSKITRLPLSSTQGSTPSTRSHTAPYPSRIARPRAISATSPTAPTGLTSRLRTMSSINTSTKSQSGLPVSAGTRTSDTSSTSSVVLRPSTSLTPSPRSGPKSRPATGSNFRTRTTPAPTKSIDNSARRDSLVSVRGMRLEAELKWKLQPAQSIQNAELQDSEPDALGDLSVEHVGVLKSVSEDSPVNPDASFDPGGSSTVDRTAVKSGYGSVFGFNMVPKSRSSVAVTEASSGDRSQSASSIGSTLSHFSLTSSKTVSAGSPSPASQPKLQSSPLLSSFNTGSPLPSSEALAPAGASLTSHQHRPNSTMLQSSVISSSKSTSLSSDSLDIYTAVHYLRTSVSSSGLRSEAPSHRPTSSSRPSGSTSRVSLPVTAHPKPKLNLENFSHVTPTRVISASSRAPSIAKDSSSFLQAKDENVPIASTSGKIPVVIPSEYPPTSLHPDGAAVDRATSSSTGFKDHTHPIELSHTVNVMSAPAPSSSHHSTGQSHGQRYTSHTSPVSSFSISPSSPLGMSCDLSSPGVHPYSPPGSSPTHPSTVNLKRLLSKPAPAGNSSASESESGANTLSLRPVRRIERIDEKNERQKIVASNRERAVESDAFGSSRERDRARKTEWEAERRMLKERNLSYSRPTTSQSTDSSQTKERSGFGGLVRSASWSRSREREGTDRAEKKTRTVLKRRPSATSVASPSDVSRKDFPYSSFAPAYTGSILPATSQVTSSGSLMPPMSGQLSSRGSSPAPQDKRRSLIPHSALLKQGLISDDDASTSSGTTPAKEIMLAYKQQQEREKIRERERNERAREKQRERELWRQEDEEQQRALKDQDTLSASQDNERTPLSSPIYKGSSSKDTVHAYLREQHSSPAPNSNATVVTDDLFRPAHSSNQLPSKHPNEAKMFDEEPSQPYYTVLGSSKRVMAAEGIKIEDSFFPDFSWSTSNLAEGISSGMGVGLGLGQPSDNSQSDVPRPSTQISASVAVGKPSLKTSSSFGISITKTLSRKMSGRLGVSKRGPSFDIGPVSSAPALLVQDHGRPSLHERRVTPKKADGNPESRGGLRLSMDDYTTTGSIPLSRNSPSLHRSGPNQDEKTRSPLFKSSLISSPQPSPTSATGHSSHSGKNKLWNLVKRISTSGLRDNYRDTGSSLPTSPLPPPPPVPALPKDLSMYPKEPPRKASADVSEVLHKRNAISTTIQSPHGKVPSAGSIRSPMTPARVNASLETPTSTSTRPGTTRSSSPISSDIGSSKFFNRSQSQRSSTSSYGEQIPPVPTAPGKTVQLQQHILPPSELYKLHLNLERNKDDSQTRPGISSKSTNYSHSLSSLNAVPSISHSRSQVNLKLQTQQKSSTEEWSIIPTPKEEKPAFSLPVPRRRKGSDYTEHLDPGSSPTPQDATHPTSPTIPMFYTETTFNSWTSASDSSRQHTALPVAPASIGASSGYSIETGENSQSRISSPPAIPLKSPRRMTSASSASSISNSRISNSAKPPLPTTLSSGSSAPVGQRLPEEHVKKNPDPQSKRAMRKSFGLGIPSGSTPNDHVRKRANSSSSRPRTSPATQHSSTTIPKNSLPSRLPQSDTSPYRKSRTFGILSDKEKDDKWDDLLERSKRAGGTLHINGGLDGLASDRLRFSANDSEDELDDL